MQTPKTWILKTQTPKHQTPQSILKRFKLVSANVIKVLAAILNLVSFSLFDRCESDKSRPYAPTSAGRLDDEFQNRTSVKCIADLKLRACLLPE